MPGAVLYGSSFFHHSTKLLKRSSNHRQLCQNIDSFGFENTDQLDATPNFETMSLTFSNLNADSFESQLRAGRKRPRVREAVSCSHCRARKIRCDRDLPCKPCRERGIPTECNYISDKDRIPTPKPRMLKQIRQVSRSRPQVMISGNQIPINLQNPTEIITPPDSACSLSLDEPSKEFSAALGAVRSEPKFTHTQSGKSGPGSGSGSGPKARLVGVSHWMAPCYEMAVTRGILDRIPEFEPSRKAFTEIKTLIRNENMIPPVASGSAAGLSSLWHLFPDRQACLRWAAQYFRTYNRVYNVVDPPEIIRDINLIYSGQLEDDPVRVGKVVLVISLAMQHVESDRLNGRWLAKQVEHCIQSSSRFQKPCIDVMQVLLLILVMSTISASETDKMYGLLAIHGLATQIANSMALHRNPSLLANVSPYEAEVRKRLWACLARLNLEYCIQSGSQFTIRLDESDCPLPANVSLRSLDPEAADSDQSDMEQDKQAEADMAFAIAAATTAKIIAPAHKATFLPTPSQSFELLQRDLRAELEKLLVALPSRLRPGFQSTDPVEELQQSMISIHINSFLSILALGCTFSTAITPLQRGLLMEIWDHQTFILDQFQSLFQRNQEVGNMARQFLWTDGARAAFGACWIVNRLRRLDVGRIIIPHAEQTVCVMERKLAKFCEFSSHLWQGCFFLGPVIAKTYLILAVSLGVLTNLYSNHLNNYKPFTLRQKIFSLGVSTAEKVTAEMKAALQERTQSRQQLAQQDHQQLDQPPEGDSRMATNYQFAPESPNTTVAEPPGTPQTAHSQIGSLSMWEWPTTPIPSTMLVDDAYSLPGTIPTVEGATAPTPSAERVAAIRPPPPPPLVTDSLGGFDFLGGAMPDPATLSSQLEISPLTLFNSDPASLAALMEQSMSSISNSSLGSMYDPAGGDPSMWG